MKKNASHADAHELIGKVIAMDGLVDYEKGAVVSRTIIKKETGTVTIFSFDKGQGLSEHTAPFDAMVYVIEGTACVTISGQPHTVGKGHMIIMPANKPHALKATDKFKMALVMIKR